MKEILVGTGTCGISAGAAAVMRRLSEEVFAHGLPFKIKETGCIGMCYREVLVEVVNDGERHMYANVTPERVLRIVEEHLAGGQPIHEWLALQGPDPGDDRYLARQMRVVLARCGRIDPGSIDDYLASGGYQGLRRALREMTPEQVIDEVKKSGLRGRGGAGFPTGAKWGFARQAAGTTKYVVCNGDEGDPGAFMDRSVLESDPHAVLEGMLIAGYAIGSSTGYIYVRAEYPKAVQRLKSAIAQAEERGFLGEKILGGEFAFSIRLKEGAGAFVCGEETALMASVEGRRGMPRIRPPFPAQSGLWGKPTNINNVETLACVSWILAHGAGKFAAVGTEKSKGTKVFALAGKIRRGGLVEVPMGITIREVVEEIGGGVKEGGTFKAVQMGGPSGGCIPAALADTPIDYESINATGAIMGSGGLVVMDDSTCMVDMARFFLDFTQNESCGKCTFCRIGTRRMLEILERITTGKGLEGDLALLDDLAQEIKASSLCGLGQTAPNPVLTTIRYFREEYEAHIRDQRCPAHSCAALVTYTIDPDKCTGCSICARSCPSAAITGQPKQPYTIDDEACIRCAKCLTACRFDAIYKD